MDNEGTLRDLEDAILQQHISEVEPRIQPINLEAPDIIAETNRFKRQRRQAQKNARLRRETSQISIKTVEVPGYGKCISEHVFPFVMISNIKHRLEEGIPLSDEVKNALKVNIDYTPIGAWQKKYIQWQAAAQLFCFENPRIAMEQIKERLLGDTEWAAYLDLTSSSLRFDADSRHRGLEDCIRKVIHRKPGRPQKLKPRIPQIVPIWTIYSQATDRINVKALYLTICSFTTLLSLKRQSLDIVYHHPAIRFYKNATPILGFFIDLWVRESFHIAN